jgi:hypothetical protein
MLRISQWGSLASRVPRQSRAPPSGRTHRQPGTPPRVSASAATPGRLATAGTRCPMAPEPAVEPFAEYCASHSSYSVQVRGSTMMACWSPPEFAPPSIGVLGPKGYGPWSLSLAYWKARTPRRKRRRQSSDLPDTSGNAPWPSRGDRECRRAPSEREHSPCLSPASPCVAEINSHFGGRAGAANDDQ